MGKYLQGTFGKTYPNVSQEMASHFDGKYPLDFSLF